MKPTLVILGAVLCSARASYADCAKAALRKQRGLADQAMQAKDPARAIAILEPLVSSCPVIGNDTDRAWLSSDLSVAYEKAGRLIDCMQLLAPLTHPSAMLDAPKLEKALQYNLDHCSRAFDAKFAAVKTTRCPYAIKGAIASTAAQGACLALLPGTPAAKGPGDDPDIPNVACPVPTLVYPNDKRQVLGVDGGVLQSESVCCTLHAIATGIVDAHVVVRVRGRGRDCQGGTADAESDMFYGWAGTTLKPELDASVTYH